MKIKKLNDSFRYAVSGIKEMIGDQQNFKIHILVASLVILLAVIIQIDEIRFSIVLIVIAQVLSLEMANTALEKYLDHANPEEHRTVGLVKDLLAGAVLISAIFAAIVGILIFSQPLLDLFL